MKYLASFHTTLKISRYLFRALVLLLWLVIAGISVLFITHALRNRETEILLAFNLNANQAQGYIQHAADIIKDLKYIASNQPISSETSSLKVNNPLTVTDFTPLDNHADCDTMNERWRDLLQSLTGFMHYWRDNFSATYDFNRLFLLDNNNRCLINLGLHNISREHEWALKVLYQRVEHYRDTPRNERAASLFWLTPGIGQGIGYFYVLTPIYRDNHLQAMLGIEQTLRKENLLIPGSLPMYVAILDENGQPLLSLSEKDHPVQIDIRHRQERVWFGYTADFRELVFSKRLSPSSFSIVYSIPLTQILGHLRMLIINLLIFNLLCALILFILARLYERRFFIPAENEAQRLTEHEQFNRKIIASAPVGISILRIVDGSNILSNELAHNYLNMLTHEDRQRLKQIISGQQLNLIDVLTSNHTHLQISFVHSRYRNENVAICVLVDVSTRVKMEQSLQEIARAAEQTSQAKSMFLATVSHELRTPLYGIIGNLDLLQTKALPQEVIRLIMAMSNSSSLLLKIISDILDFSKMESEQLKIELREFSPRDVVNHVAANYLPLVLSKQLALYCFIEPDVPSVMSGDAMRLQQVISNLLSNAIKFTGTGCIVIHTQCVGDYLQISVRDTGSGIAAKEVIHLFEPFVQAGTGGQHAFQGTGLGLAICEKLLTMMDGDIAVITEPGIGSRFTLRIPLYGVKNIAAESSDSLADKCYWLAIRNSALAAFITSLLQYHGLQVRLYHGQQPESEGILLCDEPWEASWAGKAKIIFSCHHIGMPQERKAGEWVHGVTTPHELLSLLTIIFRPETVVSEQKSVPAISTTDHSDKIILIVDDHPINRRLLADQISSLGYSCVTANDGIDALNVLMKQHVDVVLSDVNMPNMDGYTLTQCIRARGMQLPVIGITANALAEEKQRCLAAGMDSCLSKPVTLDILRPALALYVAQASNQNP